MSEVRDFAGEALLWTLLTGIVVALLATVLVTAVYVYIGASCIVGDGFMQHEVALRLGDVFAYSETVRCGVPP